MPTTYLVTGASRGLGFEFARQLLARGNRVMATVRDPAGARELIRLGAWVLTLDVSSPESIAALSEQMRGEPVDILINNAGVSSTSKSIADLEARELAHVLFVNAVAPLLVTRAVLPHLRAAPVRRVIQITSQLGSITNNTGGSSYGYRASKAALNQMNRSLANELGPEGFTCVAMHPGWVRTDMGGPEATLAVDHAVSTMLGTLDGLSRADNGRFINYDGTALPW